MTFWQKIKYYYRKKKRIRNLDANFFLSAKTMLTEKREIHFPLHETPLVSILIPFYNNERYTRNCLASIFDNLPEASFEIILINDNSPDIMDFSQIKSISIINNDRNLGFLKSVNKGIKQSKGTFIYLLNNDTEVRKGFLDELLYVFNRFTNVGAVGSKILNEDGSLQEAGAYFLNGSRIEQSIPKRKPYYPEVNFIYRADYCSGCSLLFKKRSDDDSLCLFDEQFSPAYFEDTDLCFQLRYQKNKEIYYTPFSEIIHFNGKSYIENNDTKSKKNILFEKNFEIFKSKWSKELADIKSETVNQRKSELCNNKCVVFYNVDVPTHDKDSGSNRAKEIMIGYQRMGYFVIQISSRNKITNHYNKFFQQRGICVYYEHLATRSNDRWAFLERMQLKSALIWLSGPQIFIRNYKTLGKLKGLNKTIIFDMVDIHHLRLRRALDMDPNNDQFKKQYKIFFEWEKLALQSADVVVAISKTEAEYITDFAPVKKIVIISNVHNARENVDTVPFENRKDILFIGSTHTPNIDAIYYLYNDIMPLVWSKTPNLVVNIVGNVNEKINDIDDTRFVFKGYVPDVTPLFNNSRLMVAPLRYGAGVKGKIGQAFEFKLPVITSDMGAEGMGLENNRNVLIANNAEEFAAMILSLYSDHYLWEKLRDGMGAILEQYSSEVMCAGLKEIEEK